MFNYINNKCVLVVFIMPKHIPKIQCLPWQPAPSHWYHHHWPNTIPLSRGKTLYSICMYLSGTFKIHFKDICVRKELYGDILSHKGYHAIHTVLTCFIHLKICLSRERQTSYDITYTCNLKTKMMQMNLFTKQKQTQRLQKQTMKK